MDGISLSIAAAIATDRPQKSQSSTNLNSHSRVLPSTGTYSRVSTLRRKWNNFIAQHGTGRWACPLRYNDVTAGGRPRDVTHTATWWPTLTPVDRLLARNVSWMFYRLLLQLTSCPTRCGASWLTAAREKTVADFSLTRKQMPVPARPAGTSTDSRPCNKV